MKIPIGRIPKYVTAGDPKGLQRVMLKTQAKLGYGVSFFDIGQYGKNWIAWYYDNDDINLHNMSEKIQDDSIS